jgi:hypothetical protein
MNSFANTYVKSIAYGDKSMYIFVLGHIILPRAKLSKVEIKGLYWNKFLLGSQIFENEVFSLVIEWDDKN